MTSDFLSADRLIASCADTARDDGITIQTTFEPLAGYGSPVKPAIYSGGKYQEGSRWMSEDDAAPTPIIVIDNEASQANRLEAALLDYRVAIGLPHFVLDLAGCVLPPHLPQSLSSLQFPHRNADAYLRDSMLDGTAFMKTPIGKSVFDATADRPEALLQWMPASLLFGFWQSHLGSSRSQAKLARCWTSQIIGIAPASTSHTVNGTKGDPLNLSIANKVEIPDNVADWVVAEDLKAKAKSAGKGTETGKDRLSELGHGQVPFDSETPAGISFRVIRQSSTVSFASLRRVVCSDTGQSAEARAVLVALGLVAHAAAFGRSVSLRSGCDLRATSTTWTWNSPAGDVEFAPLLFDEALALFRSCVGSAETAGLPVGSAWSDITLLLPNSSLTKAIELTWPEVQ